MHDLNVLLFSCCQHVNLGKQPLNPRTAWTPKTTIQMNQCYLKNTLLLLQASRLVSFLNTAHKRNKRLPPPPQKKKEDNGSGDGGGAKEKHATSGGAPVFSPSIFRGDPSKKSYGHQPLTWESGRFLKAVLSRLQKKKKRKEKKKSC